MNKQKKIEKIEYSEAGGWVGSSSSSPVGLLEQPITAVEKILILKQNEVSEAHNNLEERVRELEGADKNQMDINDEQLRINGELMRKVQDLESKSTSGGH